MVIYAAKGTRQTGRGPAVFSVKRIQSVNKGLDRGRDLAASVDSFAKVEEDVVMSVQ